MAKYGLLTALALIFGYVEFLIPVNLGVPGTKLGIANIVVLFSLYLVGFKGAALISAVRILLTGFLFGGVFAMLYSFAGGILSLSVMGLMHRSGKFSPIGASVAGGVMHNLGQLIVASAVMQTGSLFYLFPWLTIIGGITGAINGALTLVVLRRMKYV